MRASTLILLLVLVGIVGAYVGYWVGHLLGWSLDAEFPFRIGGGQGAILLSIVTSFLSVVAAGWWLVGRPIRRVGRLLAQGAPGHGTILKVWRTGITTSERGKSRHQLEVELAMHPDGRPDYLAKTTCLAEPDEEEALTPGTEVDVRYDPSRPTSVAIVGPMHAPTG